MTMLQFQVFMNWHIRFLITTITMVFDGTLLVLDVVLHLENFFIQTLWEKKQEYVETLTNYIEKTNRDQCFMLQRTTGKPNTAYVQLHASRLTQFIRREITWIGRRYLFEYNDIDATTYNECKAEIRAFLNKFASIAIDMSKPYVLDIVKVDAATFRISLTNLKYKDVAEFVDLYIELE